MASKTTATRGGRSEHSPKVRDQLCRNLRSKGMLVNIGDPDAPGGYQLIDRNALPFDATTWWCTQTSKTLGPDDFPCHRERCQRGRDCYEAPDDDRVA